MYCTVYTVCKFHTRAYLPWQPIIKTLKPFILKPFLLMCDLDWFSKLQSHIKSYIAVVQKDLN